MSGPATKCPDSWRMLRDKFLASWQEEATDVGVIVGCSGGSDSVALAHLVAECFYERHRGTTEHDRPPLLIAHFNHQLRGDHSDADECFVRRLADQLNVDVHVGYPSGDLGDQTEATWRQERREFFHSLASRTGCRYIVLAHTADDQSETILHHLIRGSGTSGLAGIAAIRSFGSDFVIRRPLLKAYRSDIREALTAIGQPWREDASNQDTRYTRNWIRHDVLPLIRGRFPNVDEAICRAADVQTQHAGLLQRLAEQWLDAFVRPGRTGATSRIDFVRPHWKRSATRDWPHGDDLANEVPVIIAACQSVFAMANWPRGEMNRDHWIRLADAIVVPEPRSFSSSLSLPPVALGQWPGGIEGFQTRDTVTLRRR